MPEVMISGPEGRLQARYNQAEDIRAPIALILHPHPQHGGTMNNKIVHALYHAFRRQSFSVIRFNFRGVGRSQGHYDHGQGELSDAASVLDWLQIQNSGADRCWIAGFFLRRMDRHAAPHATAGDRRLRRRLAAGQQVRFHLPRAMPVVGADRPRRGRRPGARA